MSSTITWAESQGLMKRRKQASGVHHLTDRSVPSHLMPLWGLLPGHDVCILTVIQNKPLLLKLL